MAQLKAGTTIGGKLAETVESAQAKADEAEARAKAYTDQEVAEVNQALAAHKANTANPHNVTKSQVGLGNEEILQNYQAGQCSPLLVMRGEVIG